MSWKIKDQADQTVEGSLSEKARKKRMEFFSRFCDELGSDLNVIDVGGTFYHWKNSKDILRKIRLTLVNVEEETEVLPSNVSFIKADAADLSMFDDEEFDVAYSNSMIEHFKNFHVQSKVAGEIVRIAKHYFVQTPNRNFPVEPHFLFPMFQFLPLAAKKMLVRNFALGWYDKSETDEKAEQLVTSVNLLSKKNLKALFPEARIYEERYFGLIKSFIAYK